MTRFTYNLLLALALPVILLRLLWRSIKQPAYLQHLGERFGWYEAKPAAPPIWIHAVSVGETHAAQPLVAALQTRYPAHPILFTYMTPTGRATGERLFGNQVMHAYLPYDYGVTVGRFLDHFHPRVSLIMETELWPNLIAACAARGIASCLINGRLSERSARGYRRAAALAAETLRSFALITAQSEADAERFTTLGARDVQVCGNLKFDVAIDASLIDRGRDWRTTLAPRRKVLLAASTREGEERLLLSAWTSLTPEQRGDALLTIVPRHPQRFEEVAALAASAGLLTGRRSDPASWGAELQVWIGDSMGEMTAYYALCDVAIIGGSLLPFGAQNLIEACALGKPVVLGPSTFNFSEASEQALSAGAALQGGDTGKVVSLACSWLSNDDARGIASEAALRFATAHRGATERTLALIQQRAVIRP